MLRKLDSGRAEVRLRTSCNADREDRVRATIVVSVDVPAQRAAAEAWFARWRPQLSYCSENTGCGCCVDMWDVDAPDDAVAELPVSLRAMSEWSDPLPG